MAKTSMVNRDIKRKKLVKKFAGKRAGLNAATRTSNGGLDANWLVKHGIPTITFGAGQNKIHTVEEFVEIDLYLLGCRMALALAAR